MSPTPLQVAASGAHYHHHLGAPNAEAALDQSPTAGYAPGQYKYSQA
jgi:hypothetical protein